MSDISANLSLPYIQASQAQKHVTHNEGMRILDALTQLSVLAADQTTPPPSADAGDRYIVPTAATDAWAGQEGALALYENGAWAFLTPNVGWTAYVIATATHRVFDGTDWVEIAVSGGGVSAADFQNIDGLGVQTTSDTTNRLAVRGDATLLTHDGAGHQMKINKNAAGDTASLLFQTDWAGRAEMGTTGSDSFEIKTSADGVNFNTALIADGATGEVSFPSGVTGLGSGSGGVTPPADFGTGPIPTLSYIHDPINTMIPNGAGQLGNDYNMPPEMSFDASQGPDLPGAFSYAGYWTGTRFYLNEYVAVDPSEIYQLGAFVRQEGLPDADKPAHTFQDRLTQYMGLAFYDSDLNQITYETYYRHRQGGVDSLTTLTAPLTPGDTQVQVSDATGWNDTSSLPHMCGIIIFGYKTANGRLCKHYSRIQSHDLFALGGVDKTTNTITLSAGLPANMGNPDDPNGTWPAGTELANTTLGATDRWSFLPGIRPAKTDQWYQSETYFGGIDRSGTGAARNFPPGTAYVRPYFWPNVGNSPGAPQYTGPNHKVWFAGIKMTPAPHISAIRQTTGAFSGSVALATFNAATRGAVSYTPVGSSLEEF